MVNVFNDHMEEHFDPSWILYLDELMVAFMNEHCPNWVIVKRKPHPYVMSTIQLLISSLTFFCMELVETVKDQPLEFEVEIPKTAAFCCWVTESIQRSSLCVMLDSGFGYMATLPELYKQGLFGTAVFKRMGPRQPKGSDASDIIWYIQGKEVGYQTAMNGSNSKCSGCDLWLAAMADSKHMSIMTNTWGTTHKHDKRRRRVGGSLVKVNYLEYMYWWHHARTIVKADPPLKKHSLHFIGI